MNPLAAFKVAIAALRLNALRSFLAMLGVIIGVASVIVMVSVASGAGQAIEARIKSLGTNLLVISPGSYTSGGRRVRRRNRRAALRSPTSTRCASAFLAWSPPPASCRARPRSSMAAPTGRRRSTA